MALRKSGGDGSSPYAKYGKRPHQYSELYRRWRAAVSAGHDNEAKRLAAQHQERFLFGRGEPDRFERRAA